MYGSTHPRHSDGYLHRRTSTCQGYPSSCFSVTSWNSCGRGKKYGWIIAGKLLFSRTTSCLVKILRLDMIFVKFTVLLTVLLAPFWLKTHESLTNSGFAYRLSFLNMAQSTHRGETSSGFPAFCSKGDNRRDDWDFLQKSWQLFSMWRTLTVSVFCWGQHKHLSHEAHPFL